MPRIKIASMMCAVVVMAGGFLGLGAEEIGINWNAGSASGLFTAIRKSAAQTPSVAGAPAASNKGVEPAEFKTYKGEIKLKDKTQPITFELSAEIVDRFEGDPDMQGHGFEYQAMRNLRIGGQTCERNLERNGRYIQACDGLFLMIDGRLESAFPETMAGKVFTTRTRFNQQGELIVQPIGTFSLSAEK